MADVGERKPGGPMHEELQAIQEDLVRRKHELWQEIMEDLEQDAGEEHQDLIQTMRDEGDRGLAELRESTIFSLVELKAKELVTIQEALERMRTGDYGKCSECDRRISAGRLKALPHAIRCRSCQEEWERLTSTTEP